MSTATTLINIRVFDGTRVTTATAARFTGPLITQLGDRAIAEPGDVLVDGHGGMLLPGLIDAHTHLLSGALHQALAFGVTTELDMFSKPELARRLRQQAGVRSDMADLRSAGIGATAPGGHPSMMYGDFPYATGPEQAEEFVLARIADSSDYLKIFYDRGVKTPIPVPQLSRQTLDALVKAGRAHGLTVVVHANSAEAASDAVDAGAHGLQHVPADGVFDDEFVERVVERGVTVTPTLVTIEAALRRQSGGLLLADPDLGPFLGEFWRRHLLPAPNGWLGEGGPDYDLALANTAKLIEAGVVLLAGTDVPSPGTVHGASLHHELELLVEAGLPAEQALRAATSGPAAAYGLTDRGTVEVGKRADLLLVDGDPTADITHTRKIVRIWRGGVEHDRTGFTGSSVEQVLIDALRARVQRVMDAVREFVPAEAYRAMKQQSVTG
ncbi:amidohydrolase family protein [Streptosporangium sp. NPDC000396]|uniref:amidohydrolase family protein n=1 Tax=Streptosporangium sp. NPDC000396 TaxID=3366185 RepID=UPI0036B548F1